MTEIDRDALVRDLAMVLRGALHPDAKIGPAPRLAARRLRDVLGITADRTAVPALLRAALYAEPQRSSAGSYGGYTTDQLSAAWDLVRPPGDWKGPIDAIVPETADTGAVSAACMFYAGTEAVIVRTRGGHRVTGTGYYANIGS